MLISIQCIEVHGNFQLFSGAHLPSLKDSMGQEELGASSPRQGKAGPSNGPGCVAGPVSLLGSDGHCQLFCFLRTAVPDGS